MRARLDLPAREPFRESHDRYRRQPPRPFSGSTTCREEDGEVRIAVDDTEGIRHLHVVIAFGEGGSANTGRLLQSFQEQIRLAQDAET